MDTTPQPTATPTTTPAAPASASTVDFSAVDAASTATIAPANGSHLCRIVGFEPSTDQESGLVQQWKFTLEAAEPVLDNQKPPTTIPEGTRLGTFGVFVSPSQYRALSECISDAKIMSQGLNNIVRDLRADPGYKSANAAWSALDAQHKRPTFTGTPPIMDAELEFYSQWVGTLVLATLNTRIGKDGVMRTNLVGIAARDTKRPGKKA